MEHLKRRGPAPEVLALIDLILRVHRLPCERTCEESRQPAAPERDEIPISRSIEAVQVTSLTRLGLSGLPRDGISVVTHLQCHCVYIKKKLGDKTRVMWG